MATLSLTQKSHLSGYGMKCIMEFFWTSTMDGWIVSHPVENRLIWIPQGIRDVIYHPYNSLIISQAGYAHIDFQACNLGTKWMECYKPCV